MALLCDIASDCLLEFLLHLEVGYSTVACGLWGLIWSRLAAHFWDLAVYSRGMETDTCEDADTGNIWEKRIG